MNANICWIPKYIVKYQVGPAKKSTKFTHSPSKAGSSCYSLVVIPDTTTSQQHGWKSLEHHQQTWNQEGISGSQWPGNLENQTNGYIVVPDPMLVNASHPQLFQSQL